MFSEDMKRPICNVIFIESDYRQLNVIFKIIVRQRNDKTVIVRQQINPTTNKYDDYRAFIVKAYDNRAQKTIIIFNAINAQ